LFKKILPLNSIIFLRFFGIFLVLPLISVYASSLESATPLLVGIVVGGYALTQAVLQVPFGVWSDRVGRKRVIVFGLIIFLIGSVISYFATDIYTLIFGRLLQGAGAIGSVVSASVSDVTREEERGKAMAIIGASIGMSFALSMIFGSLLGGYLGVDLLFLITALLTIIALYMATKIQNGGKIEIIYPKRGTEVSIFSRKEILYLFASSFLQKGVMAITFVIIPILLTENFGWEKSELWKLYIPAMIIGLATMPISIKVGEKGGNPKLVFILSSFMFIIVAGILSFGNSENLVITALILFFPAFNLIEPLIQSMATKFVRADEKGKVLGYTNSFAYFGTFFGGVGAGIFLSFSNVNELGMILIVLSAIWFIWTLTIKNPIPKGNLYLKHSHFLQQKLERGDFEFVDEWYLNVSENLLVVKFDKKKWNEEDLLKKIK
jgi:predicted MFS family arabinose efflux permease